jgi:hypothetical protein
VMRGLVGSSSVKSIAMLFDFSLETNAGSARYDLVSGNHPAVTFAVATRLAQVVAGVNEVGALGADGRHAALSCSTPTMCRLMCPRSRWKTSMYIARPER